MSKRFGRNQKRRFKAEIAGLKEELKDLEELKDIQVKGVEDRLQGVILDLVRESPVECNLIDGDFNPLETVGFEIDVNMRPFRLHRIYHKRFPSFLKSEIIKTISDFIEIELDKKLGF